MKIILLILVALSTMYGSIKDIDRKITKNEEQINSVRNKKSTVNKNIKKLANTINSEEKSYKNKKFTTVCEPVRYTHK